MIFVTLYAILSAVGFVVDLANHQWIAMLCVGIMAACAFRGGDDLYHTLTDRTFNQKFGRAIIALLFIALAFYLSDHKVHLVYTSVPGRLWVIIGILTGAVASIDLTKRIRST